MAGVYVLRGLFNLSSFADSAHPVEHKAVRYCGAELRSQIPKSCGPDFALSMNLEASGPETRHFFLFNLAKVSRDDDAQDRYRNVFGDTDIN